MSAFEWAEMPIDILWEIFLMFQNIYVESRLVNLVSMLPGKSNLAYVVRYSCLLGVSSGDDANILRPKTVGALDMGGASMQIAMEVTPDLSMNGFNVS